MQIFHPPFCGSRLDEGWGGSCVTSMIDFKLSVCFGIIGSVDLIRVLCMAAQLRTRVSTGSEYGKASKNRV